MILLISSCISSTKFQGAVISLAVVYFLSQIVFAAMDLYCDQYHNQDKIERLRDDLNKKGQIQAMAFRITANMLIFCEICRFYRAVKKQRDMEKILFVKRVVKANSLVPV